MKTVIVWSRYGNPILKEVVNETHAKNYINKIQGNFRYKIITADENEIDTLIDKAKKAIRYDFIKNPTINRGNTIRFGYAYRR